MSALVATAGFASSRPTPDRDSVDMRIEAKGYVSPKRVVRSPTIGVQLKSPIRKPNGPQGGHFKQVISAKNYNDLEEGGMYDHRMLVVVAVDPAGEKWLLPRGNWLEVHCWLLYKSLRWAGPLPPDQKTKTIDVPYKNQLTVKRLHELMVLAGEGRWSEASDGD